MQSSPSIWTVALCSAVLLLSGCGSEQDRTERTSTRSSRTRDTSTEATYVGSTRCGECHQDQYESWRASHHALAERMVDPERDAPAFAHEEAIPHGAL